MLLDGEKNIGKRKKGSFCQLKHLNRSGRWDMLVQCFNQEDGFASLECRKIQALSDSLNMFLAGQLQWIVPVFQLRYYQELTIG